ncbi:hypothetical protein J2T57_004009 [Natronocella acetinitrilica]|uniref:Uncharacterized protein n=1 Tax=Natronocella acetinitrilica TaxID=414046 RepID=A0AAE3KDH8_9GAMM|nr:hypothetical protein [Natronocella acetinitrilica]MCP1676836.1 hypothetical protein [Natronocella acetinitrilica]
MKGRGPVNLVWWILVSGIVLAVALDNSLYWDEELLRERESRIVVAAAGPLPTVTVTFPDQPWRDH